MSTAVRKELQATRLYDTARLPALHPIAESATRPTLCRRFTMAITSVLFYVIARTR